MWVCRWKNERTNSSPIFPSRSDRVLWSNLFSASEISLSTMVIIFLRSNFFVFSLGLMVEFSGFCRRHRGVLQIGRWRGSRRTFWREGLCPRRLPRRERTTLLALFFLDSSFLSSLDHVSFAHSSLICVLGLYFIDFLNPKFSRFDYFNRFELLEWFVVEVDVLQRLIWTLGLLVVLLRWSLIPLLNCYCSSVSDNQDGNKRRHGLSHLQFWNSRGGRAWG